MKPRSQLIADADRCVMCALCLPHCPTYGISGDENESPRGRISLMKAFVAGELDASPPLVTHLDHCLACRACEDMCPSGVPYGRLLAGVRAALALQRVKKQPALSRMLRFVVARPNALRLIGGLLRFYQRSGLRYLLRRTAVLKLLRAERLDTQLPELSTQGRWQAYYPPHGEPRGSVSLFLGCIANVMDRPTLTAAIDVLTRLGFGVRVPAAQVCCGALHHHAGEPDTARRLARRNLAAFAAAEETVITTASGCAAMLAEYPDLLEAPTENAQATTFTRKVRDISQFLTDMDWPEHVILRPRKARVAIHDPCTLTHVLHAELFPYRLLAKIPGLETTPLPGNPRCCGAAGSYMLTEPEPAERLLADKLAATRSLAPDILVTSNVGCALHIRAGLLATGLQVQVMHPVTLLAEQLSSPDRHSEHGPG